MACHRTLGPLFSWLVGVHEDHTLITRGPYAAVRHPSYTGYMLMVAGPATLCFDPHSLFVVAGPGRTWAGRVAGALFVVHMLVACCAMVPRAQHEDEVLKEEFGEEWEAYAKRTPYRLVPYVW